MDRPTTKTVRFAAVVKSCGLPEPVSLWVAPERDLDFMKAVKQGRVMTVIQGEHGKADYGVVGFSPSKHGTYLKFLKSLAQFNSSRITGVKYDLVSTPGPVGKLVSSADLPQERSDRTYDPLQEKVEGPSVLLERKTPEVRTALRPEQVPDKAAVVATSRQVPRFSAIVRFTATVEVEVEANSKRQAAEQAPKVAKIPDFRGSTVTRKVVSVRPVRVRT